MRANGILGCPVVSPRQLPSGASPGSPTEGVAGGAKQATWGTGRDRVDLRVGLSYFTDADRALGRMVIRGFDGVVYQSSSPQPNQIGVVWSEGDCDYVLFLDPSLTPEEVIDFASRY